MKTKTSSETIFALVSGRRRDHSTFVPHPPLPTCSDFQKSIKHNSYLRYYIEVGDKGRLQDNGNVGSIEKLDGVRGILSSVAS